MIPRYVSERQRNHLYPSLSSQRIVIRGGAKTDDARGVTVTGGDSGRTEALSTLLRLSLSVSLARVDGDITDSSQVRERISQHSSTRTDGVNLAIVDVLVPPASTSSSGTIILRVVSKTTTRDGVYRRKAISG